MPDRRRANRIVHICGPIPGGRSYFDFMEHAETRTRRKRCDPACFFCERDAHPEKYECVDGEWRDKTGNRLDEGEGETDE